MPVVEVFFLSYASVFFSPFSTLATLLCSQSDQTQTDCRLRRPSFQDLQYITTIQNFFLSVFEGDERGRSEFRI